MSKKKPSHMAHPEMDAMLEGMKALLTDEYGNPLPPDDPRVKQLQSLAATMDADANASPVDEEHGPLSGHA